MNLKTIFLFAMHVESKYGQVLRSISCNELQSVELPLPPVTMIPSDLVISQK